MRPAATLIAVSGLLDPRMRVEIEAYAVELTERDDPEA